MKLRRKRESGFSVLELVIVVVIVLIVTAMAAPNIFKIIYNVRLRSASQTVSGMMQTARMQAVRDNKYYFVRYGVVNGTTMVWVSDNANTTAPAAGDPQAELGQKVRIVLNGNPTGPTLDFSPVMNAPPAFNARGVPCLANGGRCTPNVSVPGLGNQIACFMLYLTDERPVGANGWAAVTVSPAGRTQVTVYNGSNWGS